ncbi:heavy-metal-associated domain-containing protein [Echinicola marina]|uniref:heavy-metal-associated domain-containing protein n=1 Tax=Echinicola marina TaxID=2859768 RepID=UPI001CF714BA|nr:heavy-metal-associated domain-containing protein [Echinicola marina]UCS91543.1 heavy-metal-associated domain-containing protein [Echinicola marina]
MIKRILIGAAALMAILVITLAVHIYLVTNDRPKGPNWTMSQIDFNEDLDSMRMEEIKTDLLEIDGMRDVRVNRTSDYLIVLYDRKKHSPHDLVDGVNKNYQLQSTLFQPSEEQLAASCPAIDKKSLTYMVGSYFENLFTN